MIREEYLSIKLTGLFPDDINPEFYNMYMLLDLPVFEKIVEKKINLKFKTQNTIVVTSQVI